MLKGVLTLELDEVVRVLFDVLSVDEPLGELEHLDLKVGVIEKRQRLLRSRPLPRRRCRSRARSPSCSD